MVPNVPPYAKLRRPRGGIIGRQANRLSGQAIWVTLSDERKRGVEREPHMGCYMKLRELEINSSATDLLIFNFSPLAFLP